MPSRPGSAGTVLRTRIEEVELGGLKLLELNARYMRHETFKALVENLRRDGQLTSVPFAVREPDGAYLVLSGNHRVKAAIAAGIERAAVMLCDEPLSEQRRIAIQLSHNAIAGQDDPATLKNLYDQLQDIDWRLYSGLDDKTLELLEQVGIGSLSEAALDFQTITLTFLPTEKDKADRAWDSARPGLLSSDEAWLARLREHERTLDALDSAGKSFGVTNVATSLLLVLEIFERHAQDLQAGYLDAGGEALEPKRWVPLSSLFGHKGIPASAAATIARALTEMKDAGEVTDRTAWKAIERWATEYLSAAER